MPDKGFAYYLKKPIHLLRGFYACHQICKVILERNQFVNEFSIKKVQVGNDQEKAQSEKKVPTPKTETGKKQTNNKALIP